MQVTEAIILAGGLGTRLKEAVPDLPKCMAPVNGRPFIAYVTDQLLEQGIEKLIFSLGYRSDAFLSFLANAFPASSYDVVIEKEPLGTGGAIQLACRHAKGKQVVALNGDSIFKMDLAQQVALHLQQDADCTLALKYLENFDRYGAVMLNPDQSIASFSEKKFYPAGYMSCGVYVLNRENFLAEGLPERFSFETDYLQASHHQRKLYGLPQDGYFIDIGIPEDYRKAQTELKN